MTELSVSRIYERELARKYEYIQPYFESLFGKSDTMGYVWKDVNEILVGSMEYLDQKGLQINWTGSGPFLIAPERAKMQGLSPNNTSYIFQDKQKVDYLARWYLSSGYDRLKNIAKIDKTTLNSNTDSVLSQVLWVPDMDFKIGQFASGPRIDTDEILKEFYEEYVNKYYQQNPLYDASPFLSRVRYFSKNKSKSGDFAIDVSLRHLKSAPGVSDICIEYYNPYSGKALFAAHIGNWNNDRIDARSTYTTTSIDGWRIPLSSENNETTGDFSHVDHEIRNFNKPVEVEMSSIINRREAGTGARAIRKQIGKAMMFDNIAHEYELRFSPQTRRRIESAFQGNIPQGERHEVWKEMIASLTIDEYLAAAYFVESGLARSALGEHGANYILHALHNDAMERTEIRKLNGAPGYQILPNIFRTPQSIATSRAAFITHDTFYRSLGIFDGMDGKFAVEQDSSPITLVRNMDKLIAIMNGDHSIKDENILFEDNFGETVLQPALQKLCARSKSSENIHRGLGINAFEAEDCDRLMKAWNILHDQHNQGNVIIPVSKFQKLLLQIGCEKPSKAIHQLLDLSLVTSWGRDKFYVTPKPIVSEIISTSWEQDANKSDYDTLFFVVLEKIKRKLLNDTSRTGISASELNPDIILRRSLQYLEVVLPMQTLSIRNAVRSTGNDWWSLSNIPLSYKPDAAIEESQMYEWIRTKTNSIILPEYESLINDTSAEEILPILEE